MPANRDLREFLSALGQQGQLLSITDQVHARAGSRGCGVCLDAALGTRALRSTSTTSRATPAPAWL